MTALRAVRRPFRGARGRVRALWPVYLLVALIAATDRLLLTDAAERWIGGSSDPYVFRSYRAFNEGYDRGRPQLIVIGSSRAQQGAPAEALARELAARGLPHQAWNLSIGGGGSPLALWLALNELTPLTRALPPGSRVVYLLSPFEFNFLPLQSITAIPAGGRMLYELGHVHVAYLLRQYSGWARLIVNESAEAVLPRTLFLINRGAATPQSLTLGNIRCNHAGLENFRILDLNSWAFDRIADTFRNRLVIAYPPVGPEQQADDREHRVFELSAPLIRLMVQAYGVRHASDLLPPDALPADEFARDCDHVTSEAGQRAIARAVVELLAR